MKKPLKILLFVIASLTSAIAVDVTLVLQFLLITYATTIIVYFLSGLFIKQTLSKIHTFLFLLPFLALNVIAVVVNPLTFPVFSPITFILALLTFILGQSAKRKDEKNKKPFIIYPLLIVTLFLFFFISFYYTPHYLFNKNREKISETSTVYDNLVFSNLDGTPYDLSTIRNKTILIDNWFLDCYQCRLKLSTLQSLYEKTKSESGIAIISVVNGNIDSLENVMEFAKNNSGLKFSIIYDRNNSLGKIIKIDGYPVEIVIDKTGKIRERHDGFNKDERLVYVNETYKKLLAYKNQSSN